MIIGFTGSQEGMNPFQRKEIVKLFDKHSPNIIHHGGYKGSDRQFHDEYMLWINSIFGMKVKNPKIIIHPTPDVSKWMNNFLDNRTNNIITVLEPKSYTERGNDIVDACNLFIATPKEPEYNIRSGVWKTIGYAWKVKKNIIIIPPLFAAPAGNANV